MISKYDFELKLEQAAEKFYFNAATQMVSTRGGNSRGNEVYFGNLSSELRERLNCQQLILPKGECPDSGILGDFYYKHADDVDWDKVKKKEIVVLEVNVPNKQKRYIEVPVASITVPELITPKTETVLCLNNLNLYGEFFGIEYKASLNSNSETISVASFNSTCPSSTKTAELSDVVMIHNFSTTMRRKFRNDKELRICDIKLRVQFSMYYFIVNDEEVGTRSEIKHIFLCPGSFFAPTVTESDAETYSKQLKPETVGVNIELYRCKLRYRPFFEARAIQAKGFGLYTSWSPKIAAIAREERDREQLMAEIERIPQSFFHELPDHFPRKQEFENVIFLNLREERIRKRSVA